MRNDTRKRSQNVHMKPYTHLWRSDQYRWSVSELRKTYNVWTLSRPSLVDLHKLVAFYNTHAVKMNLHVNCHRLRFLIFCNLSKLKNEEKEGRNGYCDLQLDMNWIVEHFSTLIELETVVDSSSNNNLFYNYGLAKSNFQNYTSLSPLSLSPSLSLSHPK